MSSRILVTAAVLAASLQAQTPPCESYNDATSSVSTSTTASPFVGLNPNSRAYQFSPQNPVTVKSAAIFTASPFHDDFMRLEIWDDDAVNNQPNTRMAVGTLFSAQAAAAAWLGCNFDVALSLTPGTNYWFVWIEAGGSIVAEDPTGIGLPRRTRSSTNPWGGLGAGAAKIRLFCNELDGQGVSSFGNGCLTSSGQLPLMHTNDAPSSGNSGFGVEACNQPPAAGCILVIGADPTHSPVPLGGLLPPGCALNTDYIIALAGTTGMAEIGDQPTTPRPVPFGFVRFGLPLTTIAAGGYFSVQVFTNDNGFFPAPPVPFVGTNALRITTF